MKSIINIFIYTVSTLTVLFFASCKEDEKMKNGSLTINFENQLNGDPLVFEGSRYSRDQIEFNIAVIKYYISNVKFLDKDGQEIYVEKESYHLIEETASRKNLSINLSELRPQEISSIEFSIGIDPEKNVSLDNTGDLDPSNEMAWNWDTGYKFLLMEGEIFQADGARKGMVYHIGGDENYKTIQKEINIKIKSGTATTIEVKAEISALFDSPNYININETNVAMGGEDAKKIADNYAQNFLSIIK